MKKIEKEYIKGDLIITGVDFESEIDELNLNSNKELHLTGNASWVSKTSISSNDDQTIVSHDEIIGKYRDIIAFSTDAINHFKSTES